MVSPSASVRPVCFTVRIIENKLKHSAQLEFTCKGPTPTHFSITPSFTPKGGAASSNGGRIEYVVAACTGVTSRITVVRERTMVVQFGNPAKTSLMLQDWPPYADRDCMTLWAALNAAERARSAATYNSATIANSAAPLPASARVVSRTPTLRPRRPREPINASGAAAFNTASSPSNRPRRNSDPLRMPTGQGRRMQRAIAASSATPHQSNDDLDVRDKALSGGSNLIGALPDESPKKPRVRKMLKRPGRDRDSGKKAASRTRTAFKPQSGITSRLAQAATSKAATPTTNNGTPAKTRKAPALRKQDASPAQIAASRMSEVTPVKPRKVPAVREQGVTHTQPAASKSKELPQQPSQLLKEAGASEENGLPYANPWLVKPIANHVNSYVLGEETKVDLESNPADGMAALLGEDTAAPLLPPDFPQDEHSSIFLSAEALPVLDNCSSTGATFASPTAGEQGESVAKVSPTQAVPESLGNQDSESSGNLAAGIPNTGNTCYLAAVMQMLLTDKVFVCNLRQRHLALGEGSSRPLCSALIDLMDKQALGKSMCVDDVRETIGRYIPQFANKEEQDVHEFITGVLSLIESELGNDLRSCPVNQSFGLVENKIVRCDKCGTSSSPRHELVRHLTVSIPDREARGCYGMHNLSDLVDDYYQPENIEKKCESCSGNTATINSNVVIAPRVLLVHLNRIRLSQNYSTMKVPDKVDIPNDLSLRAAMKNTWMKNDNMFVDEPASSPVTSCSEHGDSQESPPQAEGEQEAVKDQKKSLSGKKRSRPEEECASSKSLKKRPRVKDASPSGNGKRVSANSPLGAPSSGTAPPVGGQTNMEVDNMKQLPPTALQGPTSGLDTAQRAKIQKLQQHGVDFEIARDALLETNFDLLAATSRALERQERKRSPSEELVRRAAEWTSRNEAQSSNARYSLRGIIRHRGRTPESGHYIADILQDDGSWLSYNDSDIYPLTNTGEDRQYSEGYLMYYVQE